MTPMRWENRKAARPRKKKTEMKALILPPRSMTEKEKAKIMRRRKAARKITKKKKEKKKKKKLPKTQPTRNNLTMTPMRWENRKAARPRKKKTEMKALIFPARNMTEKEKAKIMRR